MEKNKYIYLFFLILAYILSSSFFYKEQGDVYLLVSILFWIGIFSITGFLSSIYSDVLTGIRRISFYEQKLKNRLFILAFWMLAITVIKDVDFISENIAPSIIVFVSFIPTIWFFKLNSSAISKLILIFILFTAVFVVRYRTTANLFAELVYLWLGTTIIMRLNRSL